MNFEQNYFSSVASSLKESVFKVKNEETDAEPFFNALIKLTKEIKNMEGRIFFFGNGASAAFANHMALDWSKNGGVLALSLSDSALLTALSNDYSYESAFTEFLKINKGNSKDLVVTVSSSGNSKNIANVISHCVKEDIPTFGLSGLKQDNETARKAKYSLYVPRKTYGLVECIHQIFLHLWLDRYMGIEEWARVSYQNMDASNFNI